MNHKDTVYLEDGYIYEMNNLLHLPEGAVDAYLTTIQAIKEDSALLAQVMDCHEKIIQTEHYNEQEAKSIIDEAAAACGISSGMLAVVVILSGIPQMQAFYSNKGISEIVLADTLSDVRVWMEKYERQYGVWGLDETSWILNHIRCKLFKIGRLQYMPKHWDQPFIVYRHNRSGELMIRSCDGEETDLYSLSGEWEMVLNPSSLVLDLHIQEGEPLTPERCGQSLKDAAQFFSSLFPDRLYSGYVCSSWLLTPSFRNFLPPASNILQFNQRFQLLPAEGSDRQLFERVFGGRPDDANTAPRETKLQEIIAQEWKKGTDLSHGAGFILPSSR
ncbi:acyltransferase domain-containing protein [Paenibacillus solisilvae]|uniref:Acyltransferase domain-containing protein n=2 Tax=Paenibacillus solisilvae TaxID=2486751 RepID=A0ABW0W243_9BACL